MICVPVKFHGKILGVIEVINKKTGEFTSRDLRALEILAAQTGGAVANANIHEKLEETYNKLKIMDKAKERVINHLAHELKTPLAIISAVLVSISKKTRKADISSLEKTISRGQRNLNRLLEFQNKIDDILKERSVEEKESIINIIEDAASFIQELKGEYDNQYDEILGLISERIESIYRIKEICIKKIPLDNLLYDVCREANLAMPERNVKIISSFEKGIIVKMDKNILNTVCCGLLKNAIENTPDEGKIEITAKTVNGETIIDFHDYGVGITLQNQKIIFGGFFHTQDTRLYSSKKPYEFNAGGFGADLLRIKVLSEKFGFSVDFKSTRCRFIPKDSDLCPGKISDCQFIKKKAECYSSGSSIFSLKFL